MNKNKENYTARTTRGSSLYEKVNTLDVLPEIINECLKNEEVIKTNKKIEYFNVPCAFDIETTSFYEGDEKRAIMFEWTMGINNAVVYGRTWPEFVDALDLISHELGLGPDRRVVFYVHNLAFDFNFFRKWFEWQNVFAIDEQKPVYAITTTGIEFRCSYILTGYSLASLGDQLRKYPVKKMVGDFDYSLIRHAKTPLTDKELKYCENDVRVIMAYIVETMERDGDITKIPLTKTGYVRNYCRNMCLYDGKSHKKNGYKFLNYRRLMEHLTLDPEEYKQLKRAFQGGFTHANAFYSGKEVRDVASYDFTSSYPAVMIAEQFPMSKAEIVKVDNIKDFERNLLLYCCLFDIEFVGLEAITLFEHPISVSRCYNCVNVIEDNGRVVCADILRTTITEQDYYIFKKFYKWESIKIGTFRRYKRGYLPTDFVKAILKLYEDKTTLKGVRGREEDYMQSKRMINATYGMCVTDICRDTITCDGEQWGREAVDIKKEVEKNNKSIKRFLHFPWGVWVTAYARRNLFSGIYEFGNDYVYSDTDSVKVINYENHKEYIEHYNTIITEKIKRALEFHRIDKDKAAPKTIKGVVKPLGVWDFEGTYTRFKTLGAKRYLVEAPDALIIDKDKPTEQHYNISLTVSGVNKIHAIPYLYKKYGIDGTFKAFEDNLTIPAEYTGKMIHTYLQDEMQGELTDYLGTKCVYYEKCGVHLEPSEYALSLTDAYIDYLMGIREYTK